MELREADGVTPFDFRDIMVGTTLTVVIVESNSSSDAFCGGVLITDDDRYQGRLFGWDRDPCYLEVNCNSNNGVPSGEPGDWTGSHLPLAGPNATVYTRKDSVVWGFDTETDPNPTAGDWFMLDYTALSINDPNGDEEPNGFAAVDIRFFDNELQIGGESLIFSQILTVFQVPSRDFNDDGIVNYLDFQRVNAHWMAATCLDPGWCDQADLNRDGNVNIDDLELFIEFWLVEL